MGELTIRRNRGFAVPRYQGTGKAEKAAGSSQTQRTGKTPGYTVSETLRQLMTKVSQGEGGSRESRRTLQTGEAVLAEVRDSLDRIGELARESANGKAPDRAALQAELEQLREGIDRMLRSASAGETRLFLDGDLDLEEGTGELLSAIMGRTSAGREAVQALPDWLLQGITQEELTPEQLLAGLGLDQTATGPEIAAALANSSLEGNSAAGYLAALYLGGVIAGGTSDPQQALEGLWQLLEKVGGGMSPDQALEELTGGAFTSFADFQEQLMSGTAPGLQDFLEGLLLADAGSAVLPGASLLTALAGMEGMNLELIMGLLTAAQSSGAGLELADGAAETAAEEEAVPARMASLELGTVRVMGQDLSGVSFQAETGTVTVSGTSDVVIQGMGQEAQAIRLTGSGRVTLWSVDASAVAIDAPAARIFTVGESALGQLRLAAGTTLTLEGGGLVRIAALQAGEGSTLRMAGGAAAVMDQEEGKPAVLTLPVVVDGPVSLAAQAVSVSNPAGKALTPFDIVWETLLPGWSQLTSLEADGRQVRMALLSGDPARLWLNKGDSSHGYPIHTLVLRGRDKSGRPQTRYAYLLWNQHAKQFRETDLYPNPFSITGGEAGTDWVYEEESHTLRILTNQVTAVAGGRGTDGNQIPFSGRLALADYIGGLELALGGVVCRVDSGRAFSLGQGNDVTLLLQEGTENFFESGAGYAGISLGEGTCLNIDQPEAGASGGVPAGTLTATGNGGGAGIGRDSGGSRDQTSHILIRGGVITATGTGGGAGIGAGKEGAIGPIIILGGTVTSTGGTGGGAGIGAALGAPVGDISIHGGTVTAEAFHHAAAIGAGIQGECGDITIAGTARIAKALGGNPGADIGACLFGGCGKVLISDGADIGSAKLWTRTGVSLQMGEDTVSLPQFRLSSQALQLDGMSVATQELAREAELTIGADRRWVSQIQEVYAALYGQLEQSFGRLWDVRPYTDGPEGLVRDTDAANGLLSGMRLQPSQALRTHSRRGTEDVRQLLD